MIWEHLTASIKIREYSAKFVCKQKYDLTTFFLVKHGA